MKNRDLLAQKLSKHFSLHPSRQKTLASLIFSALCSNNVHHQSLARYVNSPNPKAGLRKVERFFVKSLFPLRKNGTGSALSKTSWQHPRTILAAAGGSRSGKSVQENPYRVRRGRVERSVCCVLTDVC